MTKHWSHDWETSEEVEANGFDEPYARSAPRVSLPFFDNESEVLDADGWDDLETAAWREQRSWSDIRGDDPLDAFEV